MYEGSNGGTLLTYSCQMKLSVICRHDDKMYTFFQTIKKSAEFDESRYLFSKNNSNDNYLRHVTNHLKDILTNHK